MKKFLLCFMLSISVLFASLCSNVAYAVQETDYSSYQTYVWLERFLNENDPVRTTGTEGEAMAADWLENEMQSMGYEVSVQEFDASLEGVSGVKEEFAKSKNIIAQKKSASNTQDTVVICAHYDNAAKMFNSVSMESGGEGALDNGSGVAVVLTVAQRLSAFEGDLPYNVTFVFFGAEEVGSGMMGSEYYVSNLTQQQKDSILLVINVDTIASGDNLYVWGEDIATPQADYFADISDGKIICPSVASVSMGFSVGYRPYYNICHMSDHMSFLTEKIPVAFFFSGNLSDGFSYVENAGKVDIQHTKNDTLEYLKQKHGIEFVNNMECVANAIYNGVVEDAEGFATAVENARDFIVSDFWLDMSNAYLIFVVLLGAFAVFAYNYHKKLKKRAVLGTAEVKNTTVFERPDEEDIFTFRS